MAANDVDVSSCPATDGCSSDFPNKTNPGLCQRCQNLEAATSSEERAKIESLPQCLECGAIGKNITNEKCINCVRKEKARATAQATAQTASQAQTAALVARPGAWAVRNQVANSHAQTSSSSTQIVKRPGNSRFITICIEALHLQTLKAVGWLGSNSRAFPDSTMFGDAIMELIQAFNTSFETRCAASLQSRDVIIRWHGNLGFHQNSDCGTVGEFYDTHFRLHNGETFLRMPTKFKTTTQPAIALALFIDPIKFKDNHGIDPPPLNDKDQSKIRAKRRISDYPEEPPSKRHAPSKPLTSRYVPMPSVVAAVPPSCDVKLRFYKLGNPVDKEHGPVFPWLGRNPLTTRCPTGKMFAKKVLTTIKIEEKEIILKYDEIKDRPIGVSRTSSRAGTCNTIKGAENFLS
ncbi:hypothetical protein B0H12DRAFT_1218502 [Mycena haematopus]|nr:hypothetical protein B0H12DRAFT_1218502 [Mycena haematopus]